MIKLMRPSLHFGARMWLLICVCLAAGPAVAQSPSATKETDRTTGEYLYGRYCNACHGNDGKGTVIGFPLVGRAAGPITPQYLIKTVRNPLNMMPPFPPSRVSDEQLERIAAHIALLESKAAGTPPPSMPPPLPASPRMKGIGFPQVPSVAAADPKTYEMKEYRSTCGAGHSISVAPDGRVWFSGIREHKLGMFDPKTETFRCWDISTEKGRPHGIKVDKDGFVWFTITGLPENKITMFDPKTELFVDYFMPHTPQKYMYPHTLVFDAAQNPVFSFEYGDAVGRIVRSTGRVDVWPVPTPRARPYGIEVAPDGTIWAVEFTGNNIVEINPKTGAVREIPHPGSADDPGTRRMALDSKGNVWLGEHEWGSVGMYNPRTRAWKSWRAPDNGGRPIQIYAFNVDKNDTVWFSHFGGNYIGRFDPRNEQFSVYPHLSKGINCRLMDFAQDGSLWCIGSGSAPNLVRLIVKK